jgi:GntR family transcriptional repressor for pyruvate dehydrogenase complex
LFTEAKRVRSFDDIVAQIRDRVISGQLQSGERLPSERDLCRIFGVSRATLREGLRTLEAVGVVEIRPGSHGGVFAAEPDAGQVASALEALIRFRGATAHDLAEFRTTFEAESAYWAAIRADRNDIDELDRIVREFDAQARDPNLPWQPLSRLDLAFHETIARTSKNQVRVAIMLGISRPFYRASSSLEPLASPKVRKAIARELALITEAIRQHDSALARSRMLRHVKKYSELERGTAGTEAEPRD